MPQGILLVKVEVSMLAVLIPIAVTLLYGLLCWVTARYYSVAKNTTEDDDITPTELAQCLVAFLLGAYSEYTLVTEFKLIGVVISFVYWILSIVVIHYVDKLIEEFKKI